MLSLTLTVAEQRAAYYITLQRQNVILLTRFSLNLWIKLHSEFK